MLHGVLREGLQLVVCGLVLGAAGSWAVMRGFETLLYSVSPSDPLVLAVSALVLLLAGSIASCAPAYRAATIDPVTALRYE